jgi:hypothetical protein
MESLAGEKVMSEMKKGFIASKASVEHLSGNPL